MASGSASYAVSATNYGRNSADSYFVLSAPDVINGSLEVTGNLRVDGTTRLVGAVTADGAITAAGAVTAGSVTTAGNVNCAAVTASGAVNSATLSVSAASVLAGVTAQAIGCTSVTASGAVNATGAITGASLTLPSAGAVSNSAGSFSVAPSARGLNGSYAYSVTVPGTQNQNPIGLAPIINSDKARVFVVTVTVDGFPTAYANAILFCAAGANAPLISDRYSGNGISWPSDPTGTPGNYDFTINSSLAPATITLNVVISPLA